MNRTRVFLLITLLAMLAFSYLNAQAQNNSGMALSLSIEGPLTPALAEYLERGLSAAEEENAQLVILQLNTPGGAVDLLSRMVEAIRSSSVPVVVYVSPRGAIAGSAGTVITRSRMSLPGCRHNRPLNHLIRRSLRLIVLV